MLIVPAFSQGAQPGYELEEVIVTGSSIRRVQAEGSLPVQVYSQQDIVRSGVTSVTDFMQQLPVMQGFTSIANSVGGNSNGQTTASIHDVGEQYTLVLLNGRRVAPSDSGTTIDLNSIPLAAIESVEVLTDGASSLYGADAIAGVVNFKLKQGEAPMKFDVRASNPQHGGGEQYNLALSKGFGDLKLDGYSVFGTVSYDRTKQLAALQRPFAKTGLISGKSGNLNYDFFNGSSRSVPPNVDVSGPGIGGLDDNGDPVNLISFSPYLRATGVCPVLHVALGSECYFDYTSQLEIAPEVKRLAAYASGKLVLGDSGWDAYADLAYTDVSTISRIGSDPVEFALPLPFPNPQYATDVLHLTAEEAAVVDGVNVKYRLFDLGKRAYDYKTDALHIVAGLEGSIGNWVMSGALTVSNQTQYQDYLGGFPLAEGFKALINSGTFDPFQYPAGSLPARDVAALTATEFSGNYNKTKISMKAIDVNAQRPFFNLPGGSAIISAGADLRQTGFKVTNSDVADNGLILFDDPQPAFDLSRNNVGAYAELLLPITSDVEATASARYDSDAGVKDKAIGVMFGNTKTAATYKLGAKWHVLPTMTVRASYGTGFRTATMQEIAQPKVDFGVTGGDYDCPFSSSYDPLGFYTAGYICPNASQYEVFQSGNPQLKPETSKQWNLGWIWEPSAMFSMGLNYWSVDIKDAVESVSEQLVLQNPSKYLFLYTTKYKSSNGLTYVAILDTPINIGRKQNQGFDWDFTINTDVKSWNFAGKLAGTYLIRSRYTIPGTDDQWTTSLGKFGVNDEVAFRNIISASAAVSYGGWEHTLSMNYHSGYTDQPYSAADQVFYTVDGNGDFVDWSDGALDVPSHTTLDWRTKWSVLDNLSVTLGIENLTDKDPPLSLHVNGGGQQLGYDARYANAYGRTFVLGASMKY